MGTLPKHLNHLLDEFAVAELLGVSVATIRRWRLLKQGPRYAKVGASVRYREQDLEAFVESNLHGGRHEK